jgi:O-methyltransferase involved in polyketide biosynthesis
MIWRYDNAGTGGPVADAESGQVRPPIDTTKPHPARVYDYLLGGKDHFAVDRETAENFMQSWSTARTAARENRAFLGRAVRYLVGQAGIRQFLDIGTGLPSANNVHEVAQGIAPECRVVYVDNDPIVLAHARALLTSAPEGKTAYVPADLREPDKILAAARETLDFERPIALMLVALLHFVPDSYGPAELVKTLVDALPSGSFVASSSVTADHARAMIEEAGKAYFSRGVDGALRTTDEFTELVFHGLELIEPGVVLVSEWRPAGPGPRPLPDEVNSYGGVARKP